MIGAWTGIAIVLGTMGAMFAALKLAERLLHPHPELLRKLMHVGMGLVVISFPWVFHDSWPVLLMTAIAACALAAVKLVPSLRDGVGTVLTGVHRASLGEVCFPIAVAALWLLSHGDKILYVVPMLIMTLADTTAALVGIAYGKVRYVTSDGLKSAEGSFAFFAIAFLSVHVPLLLFTEVGRPQTLLIATVIGLLSMLLEAVAWRGLDNLLIPLGAFAFLSLYRDAAPEALLLRLGATIALVIFALSWRKRTSLDDSALMAAALGAYGVWMLCGISWLIAPALLFLAHALFWPRSTERRQHTIGAVISVMLTALPWVALRVAYREGVAHGGGGWFVLPYAVGIGAQLAIIQVSQLAPTVGSAAPRRSGPVLAFAGLTGALLAFAQLLPLLIGHGTITAREWIALIAIVPASVSLAALAFFVMLPALFRNGGSYRWIHTASCAVSLGASAIAAAKVTISGH